MYDTPRLNFVKFSMKWRKKNPISDRFERNPTTIAYYLCNFGYFYSWIPVHKC